jgi:membrane-associated phospholipid phosphatase
MTTVRERRRIRSRPVVRSPRDLILVGAGIVLLVLSALPVSLHSISTAERGVFRVINDHTVLPFTVVWTVMQLGNFIAVPVAGIAAILARQWRLGIGMLIGGVGTYYLAKVVKGIVERGRPASVVDDVHIRGAVPLGRGYVSGHAAVVTLLLLLAWPYLPRPWRIVAATAAVFVCLARVYVGAHLPLDIVGGVGLAVAIAGGIRMALGRPPR